MAQFENSTILTTRRGCSTGEPDRTVVWVSGEHDIATSASIAGAIARAARRDNVDVLVDLSGVTFMDASTVGAIVGSRNGMVSRGQSLEVRAPSRPALRVLGLCGLTHLIDRDSLHASGGLSAALGTWVDVPPIDVTEQADDDTTTVTARLAESQPIETVVADIEESAVLISLGAERAGP